MQLIFTAAASKHLVSQFIQNERQSLSLIQTDSLITRLKNFHFQVAGGTKNNNNNKTHLMASFLEQPGKPPPER